MAHGSDISEAAGRVLLMMLVLLLLAQCSKASSGYPMQSLVDSNRTWIDQSNASFRPNNASAPSLPKWAQELKTFPRLSMHAAAKASDGRIYCFGGQEVAPDTGATSTSMALRRPLNSVTIYDPPSNKWYNETTFTKVFPDPRVDAASWSVGLGVYVYGGEGGSGVMRDVWKYQNRTWKVMSWSPALPMLSGHTADVLDPANPNAVYIFGGMDGNRAPSNKLYVVYTNNGSWSLVTPTGSGGLAPPPRIYHASAVMQSPTRGPMLLIHGGTDDDNPKSDLWIYFLRTNTWVSKNSGASAASMAYDGAYVPPVTVPPVYRHACVAVFPTLFCVGGKSQGDGITLEFDVLLNRYIQVFVKNPADLPPLQTHKMAMYQNGTERPLALVIGGTTGVPAQFYTKATVLETFAAPPICQQPYISPDFRGLCIICPVGSGANVTEDMHRCRHCPQGTYSKDSLCVACPFGTYNPRNGTSNISSCIACPPGYFTRQAGSRSRTQCLSCPLGTYWDGRTACLNCPAGTYGVKLAALSMDEACSPCPYGTYSTEGTASACTSCPAGTSGPPFIRGLDPYQIYLQNMIQQQTGRPSNACPLTLPVKKVMNDYYVYMTLLVRDFGEDGAKGTNPFKPVDLTRFAPTLKMYMYFTGNTGVMYTNCQDAQSYVPTCTSVKANETYSVALANTLGQGCGYSDVGYLVHTFTFRFTAPSPATTIFIKGDGLRGLNYTFEVVNNFKTIRFPVPWPTLVATGQTFALPIEAFLQDSGQIDPTANFTTTILAKCTISTATVLISVNGGVARPTQTITVTNGHAYPMVSGEVVGSGCSFYYVDQYGTTLQPNPWPTFSVQSATYLNLTLMAPNASNWGQIWVKVLAVDAQGEIATADNKSLVQIRMWSDSNLNIEGGSVVAPLQNGQALIPVVVYGGQPVKKHYYGRFEVVHLSGRLPLLKNNISKVFYTTFINGTKLVLEERRYPFPSLVEANTTLMLEITSVNILTGAHDSRRDIPVQVQISGCGAHIAGNRSVRLTGPTTSQMLTTTLRGGRGTIMLYVRSHYDATNCKVGVNEYGSSPSRIRRVKGFWTPSFSVVSPRKLVINTTVPVSGVCAYPLGCGAASCSMPIAGNTTRYNISLVSSTGMVVTSD